MNIKCAFIYDLGIINNLSKKISYKIRQFVFPFISKFIFITRGWRVIGISGSLIWSKTPMELIFILYGEFRWSPEGPVSQIHSPHFHIGTSGIFSDLLRSVQMLKREWGTESHGKLPHLFIPSKNHKPWFVNLRWKTCLWTQYSDDDDKYILLFLVGKSPWTY